MGMDVGESLIIGKIIVNKKHIHDEVNKMFDSSRHY